MHVLWGSGTSVCVPSGVPLVVLAHPNCHVVCAVLGRGTVITRYWCLHQCSFSRAACFFICSLNVQLQYLGLRRCSIHLRCAGRKVLFAMGLPDCTALVWRGVRWPLCCLAHSRCGIQGKHVGLSFIAQACTVPSRQRQTVYTHNTNLDRSWHLVTGELMST